MVFLRTRAWRCVEEPVFAQGGGHFHFLKVYGVRYLLPLLALAALLVAYSVVF